MLNKSRQIIRKFIARRDGVAAVEFALVVPILLALYLGTMEVSGGITVNKRISRVASTVADLVTQQENVTYGQLESIMKVGESVLYPYTTQKPEITIIAVKIDADYAPQWGEVLWSRRMKTDGTFDAGVAKTTRYSVPSRLQIDDSFAILVKADIKYLPLVTWVTQRDSNGDAVGIDMSESYWLHPRLTDQIECPDC